MAAAERLKFAAWPRRSQPKLHAPRTSTGRARWKNVRLVLSPGLRLDITHLVYLDVLQPALLCLAQDLQLIFVNGTDTVSLGLLLPTHERCSEGLSSFKTDKAVVYAYCKLEQS